MKEVLLANFYFWTSDLEKKPHKIFNDTTDSLNLEDL